MKHWHWYVPAVAVVALAGCGSNSHPATTPTPSTAASPTSSASSSSGGGSSTTGAGASGAGTSGAGSGGSPTASSTTTTPATSGTTASTAASGPARCATDQLAAALTAPNGAAGSVFYQLVLTNESTTTCVIQGYAGVSFVTGDAGTQVGNPARRVASATPTVTLAKGQSAAEQLQITDAENYPSSMCKLTAVRGLRVYPPDQRTALFVPHADQGCADTAVTTLSIKGFTAGA